MTSEFSGRGSHSIALSHSFVLVLSAAVLVLVLDARLELTSRPEKPHGGAWGHYWAFSAARAF